MTQLLEQVFSVVNSHHFLSSVVARRTPVEFSAQLSARMGSSGVTFELDVAKTSSRLSPSLHLMPHLHPTDHTFLPGALGWHLVLSMFCPISKRSYICPRIRS